MALPDFFVQQQGTPIIWGESGASGVTKALSFNNLLDGAARMGESQDLGENWDKEYIAIIMIETGSAPTAGNTVDAYLACSHNGTSWPGFVTGSNAVYALGANDQNLRQLGLPVISLSAANSGNVIQMQNPVIIRPTARYVSPVIDNNLGVAVRNETTATDNDSRFILIPLDDKVIE